MTRGNLRKKRFLLAYGFRGLESIMAGQQEREAGLSQREQGEVICSKACDILHIAMSHLLMVPPDRDQVFKYMIIWETCLILNHHNIQIMGFTMK